MIGILADTHNHIANTRQALELFRARGVTRLIHCGDVTSAEVMLLFAGWQVTFVLGNMDRDRDELFAAARAIGTALPQISATISVDDKQIGVTHGHDTSILTGMIMSGRYTYVVHGHTHQRRDEFQRPYSVRVINPGALGGNHPESRSVCILDAAADAVEFIELPERR